jgi:AcrR family transcriptional regulator
MATHATRDRAGGRATGRDPSRREQILDAADAVFAQAGFHATSMDAIAERVGVGKPVLYRHFGSKERLYGAVLDRAGEELVQRLAAVADEPTPRQQLQAGVVAFFGFVDEHREAWLVLHREANAVGEAAARLHDLRERIAATVSALIAPHSSDRAAAVAHGIVGAGEALATWWVEHPEVQREPVAGELVDFVWAGLERLKLNRGSPSPTPPARAGARR